MDLFLASMPSHAVSKDLFIVCFADGQHVEFARSVDFVFKKFQKETFKKKPLTMDPIQTFVLHAKNAQKDTIVLVGQSRYTRIMSKLILETFERLHIRASEVDAHSETFSRPTSLNAFTVGLLRQTRPTNDVLIISTSSYKEGPVDSESVRHAIDSSAVIEVPNCNAFQFTDFLMKLKNSLCSM